jgi:general secretion pathway protein L
MGFLIIELLRDESIATRFRVSGRTVICEQSQRLPAGDEAGLPELLRAVTPRHEDDTVILAVDPALFSCRETTLPLTDRRKLREILPLELKGETACDTDDLIFDSIVRSDGSQLAVWGRKRELTARIERLVTAGVEPQVVTAALFSWHHLLPSDTTGGTLLLADSFGLMLYRGQELFFFRTFWGKEAGTEIQRTITARELTDGVMPEQVYLLGDLAGMEIPSGREDLWQPLPLSTELVNSFGGDRTAALAGAGAWAMVRAFRKGDLVNFRHGDLAGASGSQRVRKKLLVSALLAVVAVLICCADLGMRYWFVKTELDSVNRSIGATYREIFPNRKKAVDEVGEVKSEIRRLSGVGAGISALTALKKLAELKGNDIAGFYETEIDGNQVRLKGDAVTIQAVTDFKNRAGTVLNGVEVGEIRTKPDGSSSFSLRGTLKEEVR